MNKLPQSDIHRNYGIHYSDPHKVPPAEYRVDLCISVEQDIVENEFGVINKIIPALRCAKIRHYGSRANVSADRYLHEHWLPENG